MELIFEKSRAGRRAGRVPDYGLSKPELPPELRRARPPRLPEVAESEIVRHVTALADRTFGVDTGFYPLGSCTMKHNPRVNERLGRLAGFRDLHPYQEDDGAQGALELMWHLQAILAEIAGLPAVTLQPAAGSQGELTGLMLMRAYFADRGEERDTIITADTAHGTNPASVTMAGYKLEKVETDARGNLDLDDLRGQGERADGGAHAHEPVHARPVRRGHRGGRADLPRRRRASLLRRRESQRRRRDLATRRHGLRHRPLQPAQDVLAAARRRRSGRWPGGGARDDRAVLADARRRARRRRVPPRPRPAEVDRPRARLRRPVRRLRALVRVHARVRAGAARDVGGRRPRTRTTSSPDCATRTTFRTTVIACTSSCSRRAR